MARKLTEKQHRFARHLIEGKLTKSDAYRDCYKTSGMSMEAINNEAYKLSLHPEISQMVEAAQQSTALSSIITLDSLLADLNTAKRMAEDAEQVAPLTGAIMAQAKLLGLDKQLVEVKDTTKEIDDEHLDNRIKELMSKQ